MVALHLHEGQAGDRTIARPETIRAMHQPQPSTPGYGFGLNIDWDASAERARAIHHGGASGTIAWADLEREIVGVMLTQTPWRQNADWSQAFYGTLDEVGLGAALGVGRGDDVGR